MTGVQLTLISNDRISSFSKQQKMEFILKHIKDGEIIILERGLSPEEQTELIQKTMIEIDHDKFNGIEIETYPSKKSTKLSLLEKFLGKSNENRLTVIGPADKLKTIKRNQDIIEAFVSLKD